MFTKNINKIDDFISISDGIGHLIYLFHQHTNQGHTHAAKLPRKNDNQ